MHPYLSTSELSSVLQIRDLSDPSQGPHAMQDLLAQSVQALRAVWPIPVITHRSNPLVSTRDNYDRLAYSPGAITRDSRYSRHISPTVMMRSHTSAGIPAVLDALRTEHGDYDRLHVLPGLVYRRDQVDRTHVGAPHQLDLWRIGAGRPPGRPELEIMMATVVNAVLPGATWRATPTSHPYTIHGHQIDVLVSGSWLELAECGLIGTSVLDAAGLDPRRWGGLAMGMGLDRALMLRKGIVDIRLLRSRDPRVKEQMLDLSPYRPVSVLPSVRRDLSIVAEAGIDAETLGDAARTALGADADVLEAVQLLSIHTAEELPRRAGERLRLRAGQVNALVRLTLAPLDRTLTDAEANILRDRVYRSIHRGEVLELTASA